MQIGHIRQICTRRLIFVSIRVNSLAIFFTKRTRITTNLTPHSNPKEMYSKSMNYIIDRVTLPFPIHVSS